MLTYNPPNFSGFGIVVSSHDSGQWLINVNEILMADFDMLT